MNLNKNLYACQLVHNKLVRMPTRNILHVLYMYTYMYIVSTI